MKQPVARRLAAILAADVAGYSRLMGADEEGTLERLQAHRRELAHPKIREHHGRIVKTTGDGALVEFPSVVDAVRSAVEVQRAMVERNAEIPENKRITFRMGINLGDIIIDGNDIYGDGVNIAARLEALAEPGGICISRVVRDQIRDKLPYEFADLGEQNVKNIARPVRVYAMSAADVASTPPVVASVLVGPARSLQWLAIPASAVTMLCVALVVWWLWPTGIRLPLVLQSAPQVATAVPNTPAPRLSIVVLPFTNLSNDPEQEYFADGITDDLTTDLSRISGSFVIARSSAFSYKGKSTDVRQIGHELGVRYVLEGSVRRSGDQVQVNAQLIDAETGGHVWADRFDTDRRNLAEAQSEITARLARTLNVELVRDAGRRIEQEKAAEPDARDLVMRGWAWWYRPQSLATRQEAQRAFEKALEIDPGSMNAKIGLATALESNVLDGLSSSPEQDKSRAEQMLVEALARDDNNSMAHWAMALVRRSQNRLSEAKIESETAISLDGNNAFAFLQLGLVLMFLGQPEAGIPHIEKAIRLDPRNPNMVIRYWALGACHLLLRHLDEATELLRRARAVNPRLSYVHFWLAGALGLKGDLDEARGELAESIKLQPELNSLARIPVLYPWNNHPEYRALAEKTFYAGVRRAGFPDE